MKRRLFRRAASGTVIALAALGAGSAVAGAPSAPSIPGAATSAVRTASSPAPLDASATSRVTRAIAGRVGSTAPVADLLQPLVDDGALSADERDAIAADVSRAADRHADVPADAAEERLFDLRTAADLLGADVGELRGMLAEDGATLADVAAMYGVGVDELVAGLASSAIGHIDVALAEGLIDAEEADGRRAELAAVVTDAVQAEYVDPGRSGSDRVV